jgi:hypothetical protein
MKWKLHLARKVMEGGPHNRKEELGPNVGPTLLIANYLFPLAGFLFGGVTGRFLPSFSKSQNYFPTNEASNE